MPDSRSRWQALLASVLALSVPAGSLAACYDVTGGAAELSWSLFDVEGDKVSCGAVDVDQVRLCWAATAPGGALPSTCRSAQQDDFACGDEHGATGFSLPEGATAFWVVPVCADGAVADPGTFQTPAPIVRDVQDGRVVTLTSLAIVVADPATCAAGECTCGM